MSQSESTVKTASTTKKRFHIGMMLNQVFKLFIPSNNTQEENSKAKNVADLPAISVTSPDGQTTMVE
ncbi:unnamed protein product [Rotaria sp. Silwood1]|nr:unnamed protein product [Rotaria sp. Silwood1]CAF3440478.1 unnamed protein product [Rotaria sp. Silwood1]CAF3480411.1 unnamed protein product [Rotaria sp. Silwood1]CAF3485214.1 unnamed protein product [Rotaria sp. Silwood1]CAF4773067.1 unnamed protein product [Rotaria sp. Silwood1]